MPQVVDPRALARAAMLNTASKQESAEQRIDRDPAPRATVIRWEKECIGRARAEARVIRLQTPDEWQGGRHMAILAELAVADGQDAAVEVDVGDPQLQHFADSEAAAVEQPENLRHDHMP